MGNGISVSWIGGGRSIEEEHDRGLDIVQVNGKDWKVPSWLFLESEKSVLQVRDVPFWAYREVYGQPYHLRHGTSRVSAD